MPRLAPVTMATFPFSVMLAYLMAARRNAVSPTQRLASSERVDPLDREGQQYAAFLDHSLIELRPIRVGLPGDHLVDPAQVGERLRSFLDLRRRFDDQILVPVVALDGQAGPRIAPQVAGLGAITRDGDLDPTVAVQGIGDIGQLRAAVALDGREHAAVVLRDEIVGLFGVHTLPSPRPSPRGRGGLAE